MPGYKPHVDTQVDFTPETLNTVVNHPPSLWSGYTKALDTRIKAYAIDKIAHRSALLKVSMLLSSSLR